MTNRILMFLKPWPQTPIVGTSETLHDANGPGARRPQPIRAPPEMTQAQWEEHRLTHLPVCPSCPWCVMAREPNLQHRASREGERKVPMLVADYGYLRDTDDTVLATVLVLRLYPYRIFFATLPIQKAPTMSLLIGSQDLFESVD